MKLFTNEIDKKLFAQYQLGGDLQKQNVVAKIFNPYGRGTWYILNSDPEDPDYLWAIVDLFEVEIGSVSRSELENITIHGNHLERDMFYVPQNAAQVYQSLLNGEKFAGGGSVKSKKLSDFTTYVPNRDIKELFIVLGATSKKIKGSDIVDGVYLKNRTTKTKVAQKEKPTSSIEQLKKNLLEKGKKLSGFDKEDFLTIKDEWIEKLVKAGYTEKEICIILFGIQSVVEIKANTEFRGYIGGIMSYQEDYRERKIDSLVERANKKEFEMGLKYPDVNWDKINKKYNISKTAKIIKGKELEFNFDNTKETEQNEYQVFIGEKLTIADSDENGVVIGTIKDRLRKVNGVLQKPNPFYQTEIVKDGQYNGGYWGVVSSSKEVILDIATMILSDSKNYVKDMDVFYNNLGGVGSEELVANDIKFENGGGVSIEQANDGQFYLFPKDPKKNQMGIKFETGGGIDNSINIAAKRKADNANWSNESILNDLNQYENDLSSLNAGTLKPSKIIGGGYKSSAIAKKLAKQWLEEKIAENKKALEIRGVMAGGSTIKPSQKKKVEKVMHEFKEHNLHIGKSNKIVKNPKQAVAIALSEAGLSKKTGWKHKTKGAKK